MKKIISVLLAVAMLACFTACGEAKEAPLYSTGLSKTGLYDIKISDYVTVPEYKGIEIPADEVAVSDAEVREQLQSIAAANQTVNEIKDRAVKKNDQVNIDYTGYVDGEAFEGGSATGQNVTAGATNFIDDFLTQIIDHMPGETFDVNVTFPEDYPQNQDLAGKDAKFVVTINYIAETVIPDLTDEIIAENYKEQYGVSTVVEMKDYIRDTLEKNKKLTFIDEYLYAGADFKEIPEVVKEHQRNCVRANYEDMSLQYGIDIETLLSYSGYDSIDALLDDSEDQIVEMAKDVLLYQAIAQDLGLKVSNKDVAAFFEKSSGSRDYSVYEDHYGLPYLKMTVLSEKVTDFIIENAK